MNAKTKIERLLERRYNYQGCLMEIAEYINANNIIVEFLDEYRAKVHSAYREFKNGGIKNPYYPSVCEVGVTGNKYPISINNQDTKEYKLWCNMIRRCCDIKEKQRNRSCTYKDVTCCDEWLLFESFYEWLHSQENFDKWLNNENWTIDKDIIVKGNKIYSPETCCLVPNNINILFINRVNHRGDLPIGVVKNNKKFGASCMNPFTKERAYIGTYNTIEEAFFAYKEYKENIIKQVAKIEHGKGNITKQCYDAMMNYQVEITD